MSLQTPSPPTDVNCPRDVSRKKRGIPANTRVMKYGMRKAPACVDQHGDGSSKHVWKTVIYIVINRFSCEEMGGIVLDVADVSINSHHQPSAELREWNIGVILKKKCYHIDVTQKRQLVTSWMFNSDKLRFILFMSAWKKTKNLNAAFNIVIKQHNKTYPFPQLAAARGSNLLLL